MNDWRLSTGFPSKTSIRPKHILLSGTPFYSVIQIGKICYDGYGQNAFNMDTTIKTNV